MLSSRELIGRGRKNRFPSQAEIPYASGIWPEGIGYLVAAVAGACPMVPPYSMLGVSVPRLPPSCPVFQRQ
jgi:hypothetical protein